MTELFWLASPYLPLWNISISNQVVLHRFYLWAVGIDFLQLPCMQWQPHILSREQRNLIGEMSYDVSKLHVLLPDWEDLHFGHVDHESWARKILVFLPKPAIQTPLAWQKQQRHQHTKNNAKMPLLVAPVLECLLKMPILWYIYFLQRINCQYEQHGG